MFVVWFGCWGVGRGWYKQFLSTLRFTTMKSIFTTQQKGLLGGGGNGRSGGLAAVCSMSIMRSSSKSRITEGLSPPIFNTDTNQLFRKGGVAP